MSDKPITVLVNGEALSLAKGAKLSEAISIEHPCGGHGKCGKCKVVATGELSDITDTERALLTDEELSLGVRLACLTRALGNCVVSYDSECSRAVIAEGGDSPRIEISPMFKEYGAVIDLGTTTIAARLYNKRGELLSSSSCLNSQISRGADVISRIESALGGDAERLAVAVRGDVDRTICELAERAEVSRSEIDAVVITGNTAMLTLLTGEDAEPLSRSPFLAKRLFGETVDCDDLGLKSLVGGTRVYFPPCVSAFVGADLISAVLATELYKQPLAMLVDIGTNGEMALFRDGKLTVCSTAAGPAFEGVGISCGMRSESGAIDSVTYTDGRPEVQVIGGGAATGICGSGLVDAVAYLLEVGRLDESGLLETSPMPISDSVTLSQKDIRMLQLSKSAICAGLTTLARSTVGSTDKVPVIYVAGGFGSYLDKENAAKIGLIPADLSRVAVSVGNAALVGASMLLLNSALLPVATELARSAALLDLSTNRLFIDSYVEGMYFTQI